jgi:hypothetical protein
LIVIRGNSASGKSEAAAAIREKWNVPMKAIIPASGPDMVSFGDVCQPHPAAGEALVRVEAFSVNRGETWASSTPTITARCLPP